MIISLIAAIGKNRTIGKNNGLPWHLPADLKFFKQITLGHHLLMGRKTYDTLEQDLKGRKIIIISHNGSLKATEGCIVAGSLEKGIHLAEEAGESELFIAGGGTIYKQALDIADKMYLTEIEGEFKGDVHFPDYDIKNWTKNTLAVQTRDNTNPYAFNINEYIRKGP
jgi:dihydrofolate reductase